MAQAIFAAMRHKHTAMTSLAKKFVPGVLLLVSRSPTIAHTDGGQSSVQIWRDDSGTARGLVDERDDTLYVSGLFDVDNFWWGPELFEATITLLQDANGFHDGIFAAHGVPRIEYGIANTACDGSVAAKAYWSQRTDNGGAAPHAVVGPRCSGAAVSVARIAGLEGVPQVSMSATTSQLSDIQEFPYSARTVSPHEVMAMVVLLRMFGWDRVMIISTDTPFSKDLSTSFQRHWVGEHGDGEDSWTGVIAYSPTVVLNDDGSTNYESAVQALQAAPADPAVKSRIVLLLAHDQHAYDILQVAQEIQFQPDTIWIGPTAWANRPPPDGDYSWMNDIPGYLGLTPFRNRDQEYAKFMSLLQRWQENQDRAIWDTLPDYAAEYMVDAVVAVIAALSSVAPDQRRNGDLVMSKLLKQEFDGVSGRVSFTPEGDRKNPQYTIFNLQNEVLSQTQGTESDPEEEEFKWITVGHLGITEGSAELTQPAGVQALCFAEHGCKQEVVPTDNYPIPPRKIQDWAIAAMVLFSCGLVSLTCFVLKFRRDKVKVIDQMKNINRDLLDVDKQVEAAKAKQANLIAQRSALQEKPETWTDTEKTLVPVQPDDEQYWYVLDQLRETMHDAHISKLWRVQNMPLWTYYSFHRDKLLMTGIADANEKTVWHGTSNLDPSVIYEDVQDGFMMQFASAGLWGRGIYFAKKASYSFNYSYCPPISSSDSSLSRLFGSGFPGQRPPAEEGEREMFLAKLLVGKEVRLSQDRSLTVPPVNTVTGTKFNTVTGDTAGSQVWIVYENGRAYPDYLVRYYRGNRDAKRSPFQSKKDAMTRPSWKPSPSLAKLKLSPENNDPTSTKSVSWKFEDNDGNWVPYNASHQLSLEKAYQAYQNSSISNQSSTTATHPAVVKIQSPQWEYEVDIRLMKQTNIQHSNRRQRTVRREVLLTS